MKKTISATIVALSSATSVLALWAPAPVESKTYCLGMYDIQNAEEGSPVYMAGTCDASYNNAYYQTPLLDNGCAEGQIALTTHRYGGGEEGEFPIQIGSCMPPNVTQL